MHDISFPSGHKKFEMKILKIPKSRRMVHSRNASESHHERGTAACQVYRTKTDKTPPSAGQWNIFCQRSQYFPGQTEHGSVGCIQTPRFVRRLEAAADLKQESRWDLRIVRLHSLLASPPPIDIHQLIWDLCSSRSNEPSRSFTVLAMINLVS